MDVRKSMHAKVRAREKKIIDIWCAVGVRVEGVLLLSDKTQRADPSRREKKTEENDFLAMALSESLEKKKME